MSGVFGGLCGDEDEDEGGSTCRIGQRQRLARIQ
jgi:hypothetical protein